MSLENISFLMKKVDMYFKKRAYAAIPSNATHMGPVQI